MNVRPVLVRVGVAVLAMWAAMGLAACSTGLVDVSENAVPESGGEFTDGQSFEAAQDDTVVEAPPEAVVVTGYWEVETDTPEDSAQLFVDAVEKVDGRVANSATSTYSNAVTATVTARVPSDKYQEVVDKLPEFGKVVESTTESEDVGQELVDLDARIAALETSVGRLTEMLESSESLADAIEVERTLSERQGELDSLRGQMRYLDDQVEMSTVTVAFSEDARGDVRSPGTWQRAWDAFTSSLSSLVIVAFGLLPWLVVIGLITWVVVALVRRRKNKSRKSTSSKDQPEI